MSQPAVDRSAGSGARAFPAIAAHGMVGDRRTAALVAGDGTIDWCCLPDFDGAVVFGALLDRVRGGAWRLGPASGAFGRQEYLEHGALLRTCWSEGGAELELTDAMPWPDRATGSEPDPRRVLLRRLHCLSGQVRCIHHCDPRVDFGAALPLARADGVPLGLPPAGPWAGLWSSDPMLLEGAGEGGPVHFVLSAGQSVWLAFGWQERPDVWSVATAGHALQQTQACWEGWARMHPYLGPERPAVMASLRAIRLLGYQPCGSQVAAPTTSLPERLGGDRNYDYRFAWVRDSSLALAILAMFGDLEVGERYMDWLAGLDSASGMPLQVVYGIDGRCELAPRELPGLEGYRGALPVRVGNGAAQQFQLDSLGYLADCALIYLEQGGRWKPEYTRVVERIAAFTVAHWQEPDNGIWELDARRHYVSSKVLGWVVLDRAGRIFRRLGQPAAPGWREAAAAIHAQVMDRGWSEARQAFRQHYETEELDASTLLVLGMGFLSPEHPRAARHVDAIGRELQRDGFVWRFHPRALGHADLPLDGLEGAFLPCTFWLAVALARLQRTREAHALVRGVEQAFGACGLLSEEYDPVAGQALGNFPLLFSHAEHLKAVMEVAKSQPLGTAEMMAGKMAGKVLRAVRTG